MTFVVIKCTQIKILLQVEKVLLDLRNATQIKSHQNYQ